MNTAFLNKANKIEVQDKACTQVPSHYTDNNDYLNFLKVYKSHGILFDMLQEIDVEDLHKCIVFLSNEHTPLWVIKQLLYAREENSKSANVSTPPFVQDFCDDITQTLGDSKIYWSPQCSSELSYGLFEQNSEDLYGNFNQILSPDHEYLCQCGIDICDIHESNRKSGLYDPEDYNTSGHYEPIFSEQDFPFYDYTRREYVVRGNFTTNIFGDKIFQNDKYNVQSLYSTLKTIRSRFKNFDQKFIVKLIEDVMIFIMMSTEEVKGLDRKTTVLRAVTVFLKCRYNDSAFNICKDKIFPIFAKIWDTYSPQSGDFFSTSREFLNTYKNVCTSELSVKLYKCTMYLLSMSLFEQVGISMDYLGYTKLEQVALKKKFYKKSDFLYVISDTVLFILERGYQVYVTGDITTIFHSGGTYKEIYDKCRDLQRKSVLLSNPEIHGFSESEFRSDLDNIIEKLSNIDKHSFRLDKNDKLVIKSTLNDMLMMRDDLNTQSAARKERKAPFALEIFGDSGIGKTTITNIICTYFAKLEKLPIGSEFRYTRNPAAKFWDGFTSSCHTVVLDDVANEDPALGDPKSLNEIIQIINSAAFCPDQAALDMKGRTPMRAKLVVGTTNVKNLNAYHYFTCPSAVQRRFPYIVTPTVKEEYKDDRGMLNSSKVGVVGPYPDLWNFKVEVVKPVPISEGKRLAVTEVILEDVSLAPFLEWLGTAIRSFNEDQTKVQNCINEMQAVELCMICELPDVLCKCKVQCGEETACILLITFAFMIYNYAQINKVLKYMRLYRKYRQQLNVLEYHSHQLITSVYDSEKWSNMGNRMMMSLKQPIIFTTLVTVIGGACGLYKIYTTMHPQSGTDVGVRPVDELEKKENVWYNNDIDLCPANFSRESSSSKNMEFTDFCKKISANTIHISIDIESTTTRRVGKALCLGGHVYLTNNHNIPDITCTYMNIVQTTSKGVGSNMKVLLSDADVHRVPEKDLAFIILRELPPGKKITQFFKLGDANGIFNGCYITRLSNGDVKYRNVKKIKRTQEKKFNFSKLNIDAKNFLWGGKVSEFTDNGDCGSPLVIQSSYGYSIVGLHFLAHDADKSSIYASDVDGSFLTEVYDRLSQYSVASGDFRMINSTSTDRKVGDLHKKSVFRYLDEGNVHLYGSFTDFRGKSSSRVEESPMAPLLRSEGYEIKFTKPEMKSWVPWHIGAADLVKPIHEFDTAIINECVTSYVENVTNKVDINELKEMLLILDDFTAINGACVTYIDKMNRNTSAGNPWKKSKKYFLKTIAPIHGMMDPVELDDEIMDRVCDIIEIYKSGKCVHPNFCAHLKDEPVSFKKAKIGKTRVFTGAPVDWSIVVRKYLLSFTRVLQTNRMAFEAAPGTVAQSLEWQEMYDYIIVHGKDRIVAGDYKAFDKKMSPKEILAAFDIIIHFCELSGNYTVEDVLVIRGIAEDTAFAVVDYNGDLIQLFGSNPSGNPLTVILNSIVNSLRMRYVYRLLNPNNTVMDFADNVSLMTYGDDNIMSVSLLCDWFNHTAIATTFKTLNVGYTMADKEAISIPFIHIDDASFLKRTWRKDAVTNCMMAPLDHDSIEKMLTVWNRSKSVTIEYQGIAVISTALREYFFYGEDVFEEKRRMLKNLVIKLQWEDWVEESTFPSYSDLLHQFQMNSRHCASYANYFDENLSSSHTAQCGTSLYNPVLQYEDLLTRSRFLHNNGTPGGDPGETARIIWLQIMIGTYVFTLVYIVGFRLAGIMCNLNMGFTHFRIMIKQIFYLICLFRSAVFIETYIYFIVFFYFMLQGKRNFYLFLNSINNMHIPSLCI